MDTLPMVIALADRSGRHLHVRVDEVEGTTTTAFDLRVQNDLGRLQPVMDVISRVQALGGWMWAPRP